MPAELADGLGVESLPWEYRPSKPLPAARCCTSSIPPASADDAGVNARIGFSASRFMYRDFGGQAGPSYARAQTSQSQITTDTEEMFMQTGREPCPAAPFGGCEEASSVELLRPQRGALDFQFCSASSRFVINMPSTRRTSSPLTMRSTSVESTLVPCRRSDIAWDHFTPPSRSSPNSSAYRRCSRVRRRRGRRGAGAGRR